ncbi:MAG: aldo/keto reductase [Gemmatimonadetes bacterium]|nr:aldo/keto reductase [Gemmatimonadota bacterium]MBT8402950.1 aldo/keto reductase [Gemmatimonadota bacterium]
MKLRALGRTGIRVSPITVGAWQLGGPLTLDGKPDGHPDPGEADVVRMIHELDERGVNAVDTAEQYSAGESERRIGKALEGRRDRWVISTKFGYRVGPDHTREDDSSPETILPSLEGSLKRLGTDYIDVYLYHCAPEPEQIEAGMAVLDEAKARGKIRAYGISTGQLPVLVSMVQRGAVEVLQFPSSLLDPRKDFWRIARDHDLGTQVRGVMAQGRLSGKYFGRQPRFGPDDNRSQWQRDVDFERYAVLADCLPEGTTMAQAAIRWTLDHPGCHTVCLGAKNIDDYRTALAAAEMPALDETVRIELERSAALLA